MSPGPSRHHEIVMSSAATRRRGRPPGLPEQTLSTRARIMRAAIELFAANGFHATGVAEIGMRAGIQRGALYYHIGSKEELLWDVLGGHIKEAIDAAETIIEADLDPRQKLSRLIHDHLRIIAAHRDEVAIYIRDGEALTGTRRTELQSLRERVEDAWQRIFDEGHEAGVFRTADPVTVKGLLGLVNMVFVWYRTDGPDTPDAIADKFTELAMHGLLSR